MTDNPFTPLEETWSPEPVKAWRYFWVGPLTWNWADDRWEVTLNGDIESWEGPVKYAGQHREPGVDHQSPHTGCLCGVNAVKKLDTHEIRHRAGMWCSCIASTMFVTPSLEPRSIALSPVELAGVVDEYEAGYRAQQATIIGPMILINGTPKVAAVLADNYGIEVSTDWGQFLNQLDLAEAEERKAEDGYRQADTPDHRGTGAGQSTRTGKGTSEGRRKIGRFFIGLAQAVAVALGVFAVAGVMVGIMYSLTEWASGAEDDTRCIAMAEELGATTREVGTFWSCRVVLPSGVEIPGASFIINE